MFLITGNDKREVRGISKGIMIGVCVFFSAFYVYLAGPRFLGAVGVGMSRGVFMLSAAIIVFIRYPFNEKSPRHRATVFDLVLIALSFASYGYWMWTFDDYVMRVGSLHMPDVITGIIAILLALEMTRRVMGYVMPALASTFLLYAFFGEHLSGIFQHPGYRYYSIIRNIFSQEGMYGIVLYTTAAYVVLFVVFGALLHRFGAGKFFVELPYALTCGFRGGPAKGAVVASGFFGMLSGSATANTSATGSFTIPLMIKSGYKPHIAGAIEPAASTGGMFMPPVMGAAVFIMAELIQIPYIHIIGVALVPALLYFFSVGVMSHFEALKTDIKIVPKEERPPLKPIIKEGWHYLLPIGVLVYLLLQGLSPARSVYVSLVLVLIINIANRLWADRFRNPVEVFKGAFKDLFDGLVEGTVNVLPVASVVGTVGIILGVIFATGIGYIFTSSILDLTMGLVPVTILLTFFVTYFLGMGMTVTSAYILLAVLVAPALVRMGVDPLAAHFMIFWYSQTSNISPPVCMAAFAGAAIAKSDPYRTGFASLRFAVMLIFIPILFVYTPMLMPDGFNSDVLLTWIFAFISMIPISAGMIGYFMARAYIVERILLLISGALMFVPILLVKVTGLILLIALIMFQYRKKKKQETLETA